MSIELKPNGQTQATSFYLKAPARFTKNSTIKEQTMQREEAGVRYRAYWVFARTAIQLYWMNHWWVIGQ